MFLDLWRTFLGASKLACFQSHYTVVKIDLEHPLAEKNPFFLIPHALCLQNPCGTVWKVTPF